MSLTIFIGLICGLMVISSKNTVSSVFFLILTFVNSSILLLIIEVEFLSMIFLVIYVGAIAVLFLFVVMMINVRLVELNENILRYLPVGGLIGILFFSEIFYIISKKFYNIDLINLRLFDWIDNFYYLTNIQLIGNLIYTYYFYFFILASLILLVSMIGAITLTLYNKKSNIEPKKQEIYKQLKEKKIILNISI